MLTCVVVVRVGAEFRQGASALEVGEAMLGGGAGGGEDLVGGLLGGGSLCPACPRGNLATMAKADGTSCPQLMRHVLEITCTQPTYVP
ncbi:hypothetical protein [Streptomyces bluensis]|uniref:hypothetical protein n=1 Tax=Streptomyces bluensis TaxID=33897 RepID=UPI0016746F81|nr:hypothetical protein [Streptomyces bluensis]